ncbi:hypothetical protein GCM10009747_30960 [Agromyces humatus]|uniref:Uncharacterized protein n=1 Tax=Agromyces humatus TaxID=279573 RepID=A0ABN2KXB2_9MICO
MPIRFPALSAALLGAALILSGCASQGPVIEEEPAAEASASSKPSETPESPTAGAGSRENPVPVGTGAKHSEASAWTYTVGETDTDAWPEISAANQFNEAPAEGSAYILVPVHVEMADSEAAAAGFDTWASFKLEYVTAAGNSFGDTTCQAALPAPGSVYDVGTMYGGAQADFLACAVVPAADISGGTWKVTSMVDSTATVFFAGA